METHESVRSVKSVGSTGPEFEIERRIAVRLGQLRTERGWSLEDVAERTGISRATLSRIERSELSPTAAMLGALCTLYGWTLSRLMADAETPPPNYIPATEQAHWTDPESGYRRRAVSPPSPGLRGEMVEVHIPAGATVSFETSPIAGLEHHLWMLEGVVTIDVDGSSVSLRTGDCLRYVLYGPSKFHNAGKRAARYVIAMVRP
jgi:transcriptional regulator with XRE-family HTH domain